MPEPTAFYAHTHPEFPDEPSKWEPLFTPFGDGVGECRGKECEACRELEPYHGHLNKVAWWAGKFAEEMFVSGSKEAEAAWQWGWLAGLWHDLGKFAPDWQEYLKKKAGADVHGDEVAERMDHSTAGAAFAAGIPTPGALLSYMIAGHHGGLPDGSYLFHERLSPERLKTTVRAWGEEAVAAGVPLDEKPPLPPLSRPDAGNDGLAFFVRFLFSCLVDADFLATGSFMEPTRSELREPWPADVVGNLLEALEKCLAERFADPGDDPVHLARECVREDCANAAEQRNGFFSLTVPTGGGKTLSSLLFALRHARKHRLRRVVVVIPFTSIIRQTADEFRKVFSNLSRELGREVVLEHHSRFDPTNETELTRLAAENWDAPIIVTTNVRFFESLFANRTGACRKLHRIARSVVVLDEAQALPPDLLRPILRGLRCLVHDLGASVVLCTATQPALDRREGFEPGIPPEEIHEIVRDRGALFHSLERVTCENIGEVDDETLVEHILENALQGCLIILNTTKAAQSLYARLAGQVTALHLSARMCPRHVMSVLARAKRMRRRSEAVVLVSTQIVEAGVDISFPVVYRAECGLDSFAQAAGRCNRHGELFPAKGHVFLFEPLDHPIPKGLPELGANAAVTRAHIAPHFEGDKLLSLPAIRGYFEQAIWKAGLAANWDKHRIVSGDACFSTGIPDVRNIRTHFFKTAAERFRLIDSATHSVVVPWGSKGKALEEEITKLEREKRPPHRGLHRRAQQFTVQVYDHEWRQIQRSLSFRCDGTFAILTHPENDYHPETGLKRPDAPDEPHAFLL